jgi:hypothetical protein
MEVGIPDKTEGGFYRISCANAERPPVIFSADVAEGIGDTVLVMGEHKNLKILLR